jgi:endonuclease YncB( thermonuclease family)
MRARWLLLLLALAAPWACGETLQGKVIRVSDGDTLTLLVDRKPVKVRLTEIDAPEMKQAFGSRSRQSLGELCASHAATVQSSGKDRYGRVLGRVECGGVDASAEQVRRGMAWVYDRYVTDRSLYALQTEARTGHLGLWADAAPTAPWAWRAKNKR